MRPGIRADTITLIKSNEKSFIFQYISTDRDREGDVRFWTYMCRVRGRAFTLTVYND